ncbi:MAG TPA: hypothetical protein DCY13_11760, partial [Verrucomicrobiales bacterium]|nr:hypothetical protein [Verrucomicrobiales bacterium]
YRDDLIARDGTSTRHYALHDYYSVTAIVSTAGAVQERYGYDAFGRARFMKANFVPDSSSFDWEYLYAAYRLDTESGLYQVRFRS